MDESFRLAHISDLHFSSWKWSFSQFFSKRWLGNLNFLFGRRRIFSQGKLSQLPSIFKEKGITHVMVTGDLTTTSTAAEFKEAQKFIKNLESEGLKVFCIPGNHDQYTRKAHRLQLFYDYFPACWEGSYNLKEHGFSTAQISPTWRLVGLDTAVATSWFSSSGHFSKKTEGHLTEFFTALRPEEKVILFNHFPFFQHENRRKRLERGNALRSLVERFPQVKMYCHGHTHRQCLADLRPSGLPLIFDCGSTAHSYEGFWHQLELRAQGLTTEVYSWKENQWQAQRHERYDLV